MIKKIYIRLLEGTSTYVPVEAKVFNEANFKILNNPYLQLENDITSIWEFFPGDIVKCKLNDNNLIAFELLSSVFPNRRLHQLIFEIVLHQGELPLFELNTYKEDIVRLCKSKIPQKDHPVVKKWLSKACK